MFSSLSTRLRLFYCNWIWVWLIIVKNIQNLSEVKELFGLPRWLSDSEEFTWNVGDLGSIPGLGRSPGEGKGYPLQYSGLENSMDCIVHRVAKSRTCLSNFYFISLHFWASLVARIVKNLPTMQKTWVWSLSQEDPLEKEMATHSSILAWRIPWTEEPGRLPSMGSQSQTQLHNYHFDVQGVI